MISLIYRNDLYYFTAIKIRCAHFFLALCLSLTRNSSPSHFSSFLSLHTSNAILSVIVIYLLMDLTEFRVIAKIPGEFID